MQVHHHPSVFNVLPLQSLTMKTSHYKTPRTLAECEFVVGYPIIEQEKQADLKFVAVICLMFCLLLAWAFK